MSIIHKLPYEWLVGLRYTRAGRRSGRNSFISFISLISVAGIALGVAALIVVLSVMNGFQKEVTDRMLSVLAHIEVFDARGVLPDEEHKVSDVAKQIKLGSFDELKPGSFNIVIGYALARALNVNIGGKVTMLLAQAQTTPAGMLPRTRSFTVTGIFEAGHYEFDSALAFINIEDAERMERLDGPSGLRLRIADM